MTRQDLTITCFTPYHFLLQVSIPIPLPRTNLYISELGLLFVAVYVIWGIYCLFSLCFHADGFASYLLHSSFV